MRPPTHMPRHTTGHANHAQRGFVLVVGLVILLVLTLIGVSAMRGTTLEEHMAGNTQERDLAFQAAEAALRASEQFVADNATKTALTSSSGYTNCAQNTSTNHCPPPVWQQVFPVGQTPSSSDVNSYTGSLDGASAYYIVEKLNIPPQPGCSSVSQAATGNGGHPTYYRLTSEGIGKDGHTSVVLQTVYRIGSC